MNKKPLGIADGTLQAHIRWMIRRDIPRVLEVDAASFEDASTEEHFLRALRQRNVIGIVAENPTNYDQLYGFAVYALHKRKLHVMSLAVGPGYRRRRIGTQLVAKLAGKLSSQRRQRLTINVPDNNMAAHLFLKAQGFEAQEVVRGQYGEADGYLFALEVPRSSEWDENC